MKRLMILVLLFSLLSGCYWMREVESDEAGIKMDDGVSVSDVVGAGRYSNGDWYGDLVVISVSSITTEWSDPSLVTKDKQPVSLVLNLTFKRSALDTDVEMMWTEYREEALHDEALITLVHSRVPSAAKSITTLYTLDQMLGIAEGEEVINRQVVETKLKEILSAELAEVGVILLNAAIGDIGVDQAYLDALSKKAQAQIESEIAKARTLQLAEQLLQEQAQTQIALEIANRQNEVNELLAQAFADNPEFFELEKLKLLANLLDENDLVIYVPEGSDIATVLGTSGVIPTDTGGSGGQ